MAPSYSFSPKQGPINHGLKLKLQVVLFLFVKYCNSLKIMITVRCTRKTS